MAKGKDQYITQISPSTTLRGDIYIDNDVRIAGKVEGNVQCTQDFVLESSGLVVGDIISQSANLAGALKGNIKVTERRVLENGARVEGDLEAQQLRDSRKAPFQGKCQ